MHVKEQCTLTEGGGAEGRKASKASEDEGFEGFEGEDEGGFFEGHEGSFEGFERQDEGGGAFECFGGEDEGGFVLSFEAFEGKPLLKPYSSLVEASPYLYKSHVKPY